MATRTLALTATLLLTLGGCVSVKTDEYSDARTESATVSEIALAGGAGDVTIQRGTEPTVQIERHFQYHGRSKPAGRDRIDDALLHLDTDCGNGCTVSYTVTVPNEVRVSGHNDSGRVSLQGVSAVTLELSSGTLKVRGASGNITAQTGSGAIDIEDVKGSVTATAGSGAVRIVRSGGLVVATARSGQVDVRDATGESVTAGAQSGDVSVTLAKPQAVRAKTRSGGIRVVVPATVPVNTHTNTRSGHLSVSVPIATDGASELDLTTMSGDISVVPA
jgi:hypothetical protein